MRFTTTVKIEPSKEPIELGTPILALGSCFADRIGRTLDQALFPVTINPTGIFYNPISLARGLELPIPNPQLFLHQGRWRSLNHHSRLAGETAPQSLRHIAEAESLRQKALGQAQLLILTLGTAQVFELQNRRHVVTNCHRLPQSLFYRRRLSLQEAVQAMRPSLHHWLAQKPRGRVILTVSPVRYLKGGLVENSRAKAVLVLACEELCRALPRVDYFPAYEILHDELRDYRFYLDDLVQPSDLAVGHVWEAFCKTYFGPKAMDILSLIQKANLLAQHRLTGYSKPQSLAAKGLSILDEIESKQPGLETSRLKQVFDEWKSV
jgi:GSCFA family